MTDYLNGVCHAVGTWAVWMSDHWNTVGAAILMVLQGVYWSWKLYDKYKGRKDG